MPHQRLQQPVRWFTLEVVGSDGVGAAHGPRGCCCRDGGSHRAVCKHYWLDICLDYFTCHNPFRLGENSQSLPYWCKVLKLYSNVCCTAITPFRCVVSCDIPCPVDMRILKKWKRRCPDPRGSHCRTCSIRRCSRYCWHAGRSVVASGRRATHAVVFHLHPSVGQRQSGSTARSPT